MSGIGIEFIEPFGSSDPVFTKIIFTNCPNKITGEGIFPRLVGIVRDIAGSLDFEQPIFEASNPDVFLAVFILAHYFYGGDQNFGLFILVQEQQAITARAYI